jgi:hypothetical protein
VVSAVLRQPIPIMPWISVSRTLIGIGCLKPAATADTKKTSFFVSYKWYRSGGPIPKIPYQPILQTYSVVVIAYLAIRYASPGMSIEGSCA